MEPGPHDSPSDFQQYSEDALDSLPPDLRARMSNVEIVIEDEPPAGQPLLGLYQGVPLTRRGSSYGAVLPGQDHDFPRTARTTLRAPRGDTSPRSEAGCAP